MLLGFSALGGLAQQSPHMLPGALPTALKVPTTWWPRPLNSRMLEDLGNGSLVFPCISSRLGSTGTSREAAGSPKDCS